MTAAGDPLDAARTAAEAGDWKAARRYFEAAVEHDPSPEALAGLGDTLWWLGSAGEAVRYQERAYAGFQRRGDPMQSALMAIGLYLTYRVSLGNTAAARGWLARAARLVDESKLAPLSGWVTLLRAHDARDPVAAELWARQARAAAAPFDDPDLELCALSQLGASLVQQGRLDEGTAMLDEAMAGALAGECRRPHTAVYTACAMISSCVENAQLEHALQWLRAADAFTRRFGSTHLYTHCRIYHGAALFASGDWAGAERELLAAAAGSEGERALYAEAAARLAEVRLAQGRLEEAERLLEGLGDHTTSCWVLAALADARGETVAARRIARRCLRALEAPETDDWLGTYRSGLAIALEAGRLWEVLAEASEGTEATSAVECLDALARRTHCAQLRARALRAAGRAGRDVSRLERALSLFAELSLPLEAARCRLLLAEVIEGADAIAEATSALAGFVELGAARDADRAAARLRELGVTTARGGPSGSGGLTLRESEVLELLGEGLSNRELAERLFLSRKTVERHVRNVLLKIGVRNRAEAAAYVVRHRAEMRSTD